MKRVFYPALRFLIKIALQFSLGGGLYIAIEAVWRHLRGHAAPGFPTFLLGGGACLLGVALARVPLRGWKRYTLLPLAGGVLFTAYEYAFGYYFREVRHVLLWDYRGMPYTFDGLINLQFSLAWVGLALFLLLADAFTEQKLLKNTPFAYARLFRA